MWEGMTQCIQRLAKAVLGISRGGERRKSEACGEVKRVVE